MSSRDWATAKDGNFSQRLAEHGLIDRNPSFARQVALREVARLAMVRLHFFQRHSVC